VLVVKLTEESYFSWFESVCSFAAETAFD